jgi:23S rRNA (uracil1939-C5)-methyltransferase
VFGEKLLAEDGLLASAAGFAQANRAQNRRLRDLVLSSALAGLDRDARILELYAGDGNFTRELAAGGCVVAVESDRQAAARLATNLRALGETAALRCTIIADSCARAVRRLARAGERFDVAVLDPPRAGAADVLESLAQVGPRRIVYVSCDPMTLARDAERLARLGYLARVAQPIDMMPHTSHIEVVLRLDQGDVQAMRAK